MTAADTCCPRASRTRSRDEETSRPSWARLQTRNPEHQYELIDVIGNGSFGIIRKVRRKQDGVILAQKEIDFERMNERDRKQVVAGSVRLHPLYVDGIVSPNSSVSNILKDLDHDHIVRYYDRHVDRDAGTLYIFMEYCGGGDLSSVIKQAQKNNRLIPEETVWHYFMQILLALHYCHHPNAGNSRSGGSAAEGERKAPILHRDIKPDNVFLDENNSVLTQASLANTYVGTPYYMSPELIQEKAYDSKSDICNGRIPPLPRGYSQALTGVIKAMLNLNPSMRPSAAQLLQHERALIERERELVARESVLASLEAAQNAAISMKDNEIASLQAQLAELAASIPAQMEQAVAYREQELRSAVLDYEKVVELRVQRREQEIMEAVRMREAEMCEAWQSHETMLRATFQAELEERWRAEQERLEHMREEIEEKTRALEESQRKGQKKDKTPLEEVKNILAPLAQLAKDPQSTPRPNMYSPTRSTRRPFETPAADRATPRAFPLASAMKGVILTTTGEPLATPMPSARLVELLTDSPRVGAGGSLGFSKIFDFDRLDEEDDEGRGAQRGRHAQAQAPVPTSAPSINRSPSKRKSVGAAAESLAAALPVPTRSAPAPPSQPARRLRRPSSSSSTRTVTSADAASPQPTVPTYDLQDEENLPSPFLRRIEREPPRAGAGATTNHAGEATERSHGGPAAGIKGAGALAMGGAGRSSVVRRAGEEARSTLLRM
ncbi:kinase-like domain-containing protein [Lactarius deliciosus]|nr:kinase-like domain-containing protein [Lactarius deliciosus]